MEKEAHSGNNNILVSVIIATCNAGKIIADCLSSIKAQSNKNIEIVIVDAESTDNTIDIIRQFKFDKLTWISEADEGIYDALNKGIKIAKGKWFYFLGADDRLLPGFSEMLARLTNENTIYYGNCEPFYEGDDPGYTILRGVFDRYRLSKVCINHQSVIYPAKVFLKYNYNLKYKVFADWALNIKIWGDKAFQKQFYPITITRYNLNGFSSMHKDVLFERDKPQLVKQNFGWLIYLRFLFKRFKQRRKRIKS